MAVLRVNIADLAGTPSVIFQMVVHGLTPLKAYCGTERVDDCWLEYQEGEERLRALADLFKVWKVRAEVAPAPFDLGRSKKRQIPLPPGAR